MKLTRIDFFYSLLILLITIVTVFDLFINTGRSANMDGLIHTTTIAMFSQAIAQGDFPVRWLDGFGNYGFPVGIIAHQLPTYLGAFINLVVNNPVTAFNIVCFVGLLLSNLLFFIFLRIYFDPEVSFMATFLFNFAPYRIINLYIRGAIPEAFSNIFLPLALISIYYFIRKKRISFLFLLILSIALMALSHPMTLIIYSFVFVPYALFCLLQDSKTSLKSIFSKRNIALGISMIAAGILALGIAGYYVIPLNLEVKYFYYGLLKNHLTANQYMGLRNFFDPNWYYFSINDIFPRGHIIEAGLLETAGVIIGLFIIVWQWTKNKKIKFGILEFAVLTSLLVALFTTKYSNFFYAHVNILSNIQFPWRMFSAFIFLPPIVYAIIFQKINKKILMVLFILFIAIIRFPQLYGKNYAYYPPDFYLFTPLNLHSTAMNTIWSGRTEDYPIQKTKPAIINGKGKIISENVKNSSRLYKIDAKTPIRMVDYTFYFPGWNVYVNGVKTNIEYQDPNYRGVITYNIPQGTDSVSVKFEDTKVRFFGKLVSLGSIGLFAVLFFFRKRIAKFVYV